MFKLRKKSHVKIHRQYVIIGVVSMIVNLFLLLFIFSYIQYNGNDMIMARGQYIKCSEERRDVIANSDMKHRDKQVTLASLDYECFRNGSFPHYEKGFNNYLRSIGIEP